MENKNNMTRRALVKSSILGAFAVSIPNIIYSKNILPDDDQPTDQLPSRYPSIDDVIVSEVVGASHFNLDRVKELVNHRPELSRATWDWGFGDWETAIGAASHVGRRDIIEYLISMGARPDVFTFAALGNYEAVKSMMENQSGIHFNGGPHGISLLRHANAGLSSENLSKQQIKSYNKLVDYLEKLEEKNGKPEYLETLEKEKYLGDYKYGEGPNDGFTIKLNMRDLLSLGKLGKFGGALYQIDETNFIYNGTTSVKINFTIENNKVISLTIHEPDLVLTAKKVA